MFARSFLLAISLFVLCDSNVRADAYEWSWTGQLIMRDASDWDGVDADVVIDAMVRSAWFDNHHDREEIVNGGALEAKTGLCGAAAYHKYNVAPGDEWCSEFARTTLLAAGAQAKNCIDGNRCQTLPENLGVSDFESYFRRLGGWTAAGYISPSEIQPGDYIALNTHGDTGNHSGIILAISNDYQYIWTAEGNVTVADGEDCVRFMRRPLVVDGGNISGDIYGIGNSDTLFQ